MNTPSLLCVISARGGSQGVPGKNVRPLFGKPVIARAVETALAAPEIARVVVSTDSPAIAEAAVAAGAVAPQPLDPAAAVALGLTPEQQAQMVMQFPLAGLTPEALAAAGVQLPTGPDGAPLPLTLPIMGGGGGEGMQQMVLDPSALATLNIPIFGTDGQEMTAEQVGGCGCRTAGGCC